MRNIFKIIEERHVFYAVLLINMFPVLFFRFFPTMDGPAHLYNSNIINTLLFSSHSLYNDYFIINPEPVPNWLSHFVLLLARQIFPAWLAEKFLLILYFTLLPMSFRALVKVYNKPELSYIIFPFTYSFLFYIGFYNFCLAFVLLFFTIRYWLLNNNSSSFKFVFILGILITTTYFSHILVYSFLLFSLFVLISQESVLQYFRNSFGNKRSVFYFKKYMFLLVASLPTLILFVYFFIGRHFPSDNQSLSNSELFKWIIDIRPIISLDYNLELQLTKFLYYLFIVLMLVLLYQRVKQIDYEQHQTFFERMKYSLGHGVFLKTDIFLFITMALLLLLFNIPNGAGAGMMSDRLALLFYIFFIFWLAIQSFPKYLKTIAIVIIVSVNMGFLYRYMLATRDLNSMIKPIIATTDYIEPNSTVLPLNYSDHWLALHFSNYLGIEKPIVVLENYEADVGWFPICWNKNRPKKGLTDADLADYVFVFKKDKNKAYEANIEYTLKNYYNQVQLPAIPDVLLYKLK